MFSLESSYPLYQKFNAFYGLFCRDYGILLDQIVSNYRAVKQMLHAFFLETTTTTTSCTTGKISFLDCLVTHDNHRLWTILFTENQHIQHWFQHWDQCQLWLCYNSNYTIHQRNLKHYHIYTTTLQYTCCTQTDNPFMTTTY